VPTVSNASGNRCFHVLSGAIVERIAPNRCSGLWGLAITGTNCMYIFRVSKNGCVGFTSDAFFQAFMLFEGCKCGWAIVSKAMSDWVYVGVDDERAIP
jgi:hypothetical protein